MDFEKAYKEALERAKQGLPIDEIFPELKESEDERIRRGLLRCLDDIEDGWIVLHGISKNDAIAYLEKQKEQPSTADDIAATAYQLGLVDGRKERLKGFIKQNKI